MGPYTVVQHIYTCSTHAHSIIQQMSLAEIIPCIFTYIHAYQARLKYFHAQSTGTWKQVHMFYTHHDIDIKIYGGRIINIINTYMNTILSMTEPLKSILRK